MIEYQTPFFMMCPAVAEASGVSSIEAAPAESQVLCLKGDWTIASAGEIDRLMQKLRPLVKKVKFVDLSALGKLDTTGSILVRRCATLLDGSDISCDPNAQVDLINIRDEHFALLGAITCSPPIVETVPPPDPWYEKLLLEIGEASAYLARMTGSLVGFIGLVLVRILGIVAEPKRFRFVPFVHQLEVVGFKALWIVGLIAFLIGAVMVNQGAVQLAKFGADIFVIDMLGISQLRELGVLMTSIIVAGRSGSAFTAQIGSMRLHEEVDALLTIGMNPIDVLVIPRTLALMVALPLLTFYADMVGIFGGALMAWWQLGITPANFFFYFNDVIVIDHLFVGLLKAPFFAAIIAISGCYEGLRVERSADSLGYHTTRSVVQSIFLVISLDALFAVFFTAIDL